MKTRPLEWGQTPWDNLGREELLEHVKRLYSAVHSATSVLEYFAQIDAGAGYWTTVGNGGRAIAKLRQAEAMALRGQCPSELYRCFYRYADDLLFATPIGRGWRVCELGHMTGNSSHALEALECALCKGGVRPIGWRDLTPAKAA